MRVGREGAAQWHAPCITKGKAGIGNAKALRAAAMHCRGASRREHRPFTTSAGAVMVLLTPVAGRAVLARRAIGAVATAEFEHLGGLELGGAHGLNLWEQNGMCGAEEGA